MLNVVARSVEEITIRFSNFNEEYTKNIKTIEIREQQQKIKSFDLKQY